MMRIAAARPALVATVVALFVSAASATAAATLVITTANIKNETIQSIDVKNGSLQVSDLSKAARTTLKGATGAKGDKGDTGAAGATGPSGSVGVNGTNGLPGQSGSSGPSLLFSNGAVTNNSVTWSAPGGGAVGSEAGAQRQIPPGTSVVARDLAVQMVAAPNGGGVVVTVRRNGTDTTLSCTVPAGQTTCTTTNTVNLTSGDLLSVEIDSDTPNNTVDTAVSTGFKLVY